jgi:hypothetical protein
MALLTTEADNIVLQRAPVKWRYLQRILDAEQTKVIEIIL